MALEVRFTCDVCSYESHLVFADKPEENIRCAKCQAKFIGESLAALDDGSTLMTGKTLTPKEEQMEALLKNWLAENKVNLAEKLKP